MNTFSPLVRSHLAPPKAEAKALHRKPLAQALHVAGIKPFTADSVARYKANKTRCLRLTHAEIPEKPQAILALTGLLVHSIGLAAWGWGLGNFSLPFGVFLGSLPVTMITLIIYLEQQKGLFPHELTRERPIASFILFVLLCCCGIAYHTVLVYLCGPPSKRWQLASFWEHQGKMPGYALETAGEIRMRCPDAYLYVEELVQNNRVIDPFLVVKLGTERYYVEVWDEPDYDQKRMV